MHARLPAILAVLAGVLASILAGADARGEDNTVPPPGPAETGTFELLDSISCGAVNRGSLYGAVSLPQSGIGFATPEPWWSRGHRFGTAELVGLIQRVAAVVEEHHPGGILGVADLSDPDGGPLPGHRSHQAGRDVDLIFYALDPGGQPFSPDMFMAYYTVSGRADHARAPTFARDIAERYFDLARNWALVKALITDPEVQVERIFVSQRIRQWLLTYARSMGEPEDLIELAAFMLRRPSDGEAHNDHMHVRIACSAEDIEFGRCQDQAARRPRRARRWRAHVTCPAAVPDASMVQAAPAGRPHGGAGEAGEVIEAEPVTLAP